MNSERVGRGGCQTKREGEENRQQRDIYGQWMRQGK